MTFRKQGESSKGSSLPPGQLPWSVIYYLAANGSAPAPDFLSGCSPAIRAQFAAVLDAVAGAPPPRFSGGGLWEAMHGDMSGWYEIRVTGPGREQVPGRSACWKTEPPTNWPGAGSPAIAVITGMRKPWRTAFSERDYEYVRHLGDHDRQNFPRKLAQ